MFIFLKLAIPDDPKTQNSYLKRKLTRNNYKIYAREPGRKNLTLSNAYNTLDKFLLKVSLHEFSSRELALVT